MFWKARIENKSPLPQRLVGIVVKHTGTRLVVRFNLEDGSCFDAEGATPRFDKGEEFHVTLHNPLEMPTTDVEPTGEPT